ncbi:phytanoyl-CoA dioxygenase family protein [Haliangium sp.]|uniref:phytanoyl-CoA dioxygenase family protein n=1 Tax=Haliangium sp. TaxID=2663208 RepID=UPI003D0C10BF
MRPTQIDVYTRDGFVRCGRVFDDAEMDVVRAGIERVIENRPAGTAPEQIMNLHFDDAWLLELAAHPRILDAVESILGPELSLFTTRILSKSAGVGHPIPWHQDSNYWPLEPLRVVSFWLAIDDVDRDNGTMEVVPGSHTRGNLPTTTVETEDDRDFFLHIPEHAIDVARALPVEIEAGEATLHDAFLVHRSIPNLSSRRRCVFIARYVPGHTRIRPNDFPLFSNGYELIPVRGGGATALTRRRRGPRDRPGPGADPTLGRRSDAAQ